jgi:hypothetical protein
MQESKRSPNDVVIKDIRRAPLTIDDLLKAKEVFLTGSTLRVMPVVSIDEENIAGGRGAGGSLCIQGMLPWSCADRQTYVSQLGINGGLLQPSMWG